MKRGGEARSEKGEGEGGKGAEMDSVYDFVAGDSRAIHIYL